MSQCGEAGGVPKIPGHAVGESRLRLLLIALQGKVLAVLGMRAEGVGGVRGSRLPSALNHRLLGWRRPWQH